MDLKKLLKQKQGEIQQAIAQNDLLRQQSLKVEEQIKQSDFAIAEIQGQIKILQEIEEEKENKK